MLKIIISPAKKMRILEEYPCRLTSPVFQEKAERLHAALLRLSFGELKQLWNCSERLAVQNYERLHAFDPCKNLSPALLAYEGIQYQYMAPQVFSESQWSYAEEHLRILSGFYGILRPTDGVIPYRLEMQAKLAPVHEAFGSVNSLYEYWGDSVYRHLAAEMSTSMDSLQIVNLASEEYGKSVLPFIAPPVTLVTCVFGEWDGGRVKVKGTPAKMARGEMVRWMAENQIEEVHRLREFHHLDYRFHKELSSETKYVFLKSREGGSMAAPTMISSQGQIRMNTDSNATEGGKHKMDQTKFFCYAKTSSARIPYSVEICSVPPDACAAYTDQERFRSLCEDGCPNYARKWSCPPFAPLFTDFTSKWTHLYVLFLHTDMAHFAYIKNDYLKIKAANNILKSRADRYLRAMSKLHGSSISTGSCRLCKPCKCKQDLPCAHPDIMTYSFEALGIHVGRMVEDCFGKPLLWYRRHELPEYTSVVCGILTNERLTMKYLEERYQSIIG